VPVPEPQWPDDYFELQESPVDAAMELPLAPEAPFALQDPFGVDEWAAGLPDKPPFDLNLPACAPRAGRPGGEPHASLNETTNSAYSRGASDDDPPAHSLLDLNLE